VENMGTLFENDKPNRLLNRHDIVDKLEYGLLAYVIAGITICISIGFVTRNEDLLWNVAMPMLMIGASIMFCHMIVLMRVYGESLRVLIYGYKT
jgi:hypothetical protein